PIGLEGGIGTAEEARLAAIGPRHVLRPLGQADEGWNRRLDGALHLGDGSAEAGMAAQVPQRVDRPAAHALHRIVSAGGADDGADDGELVHASGDLWEGFADLDAGDPGGDRLEFASDFLGGPGLSLPLFLA